jgi:hypothetical protein
MPQATHHYRISVGVLWYPQTEARQSVAEDNISTLNLATRVGRLLSRRRHLPVCRLFRSG